MFITVPLFLLCASFGALVGSLVTTMLNRSARGESFSVKNFHCRSCGKSLGMRSLIPVVSFLLQRGRCLDCGEKIGLEYFLLESLNALVYGSLYLALGFGGRFLYMSLLFSLLTAITIADLRTQEIPIHFQIAFCIFALLRVLFSSMDPLYGIVCAIAYFALVEFARIVAKNFLGREVVGGGDLVLIALSGLMLNMEYLSAFFLATGLLGTLFGLARRKIRGNPRGGDESFPLTPVIALVLYSLLLHHYRLPHRGR